MVDAFLREKPEDWPFYNSFMETFRKDIKPLVFIEKLLYDAGAVISGLSGSGSALFGLYRESETLVEAERLLLKHFPLVERFKFLRGIPEAVVI